MSRRAKIGAAILLLWAAGLFTLARRELFRGEPERMERAGLLVAPGAEYYAVRVDSASAGYASSTIDTTTTQISIKEFLLVELPAPGGIHRLAARSLVVLARSTRLQAFRYELGQSFGPSVVSGTVEGDSALVLISSGGTARPDTSRVSLHGVLMLPTTLPFAVALEQRMKVGQRFTYAMFDPVNRTVADVTVGVQAESLFVVTDSAGLAPGDRRWTSAHDDTVRAWKLEDAGQGLVNGWVDEKGRVVRASPLGHFTLQRTAYEIAARNWTLEHNEHPQPLVPRVGRTAGPPAGPVRTPRP